LRPWRRGRRAPPPSSPPATSPAAVTGDLIEGLEGVVLALGDLAYDDGTSAEFADCYHPAWGSFKARTRPVPGNHEYHTVDAAGFYGYFASLPKYYKFSSPLATSTGSRLPWPATITSTSASGR
jgi:hypothetical protein